MDVRKGSRRMTDGWRKDTFTFEITAYVGTLSTKEDRSGAKWAREVNIVSWNSNAPKVDIREWNEDHTKMSKGITLTEAEAKKLYEVLKGRYE